MEAEIKSDIVGVEARSAPRRRVVIIASYAPSLWNFRAELIELLVQRGYEVIACAPRYDQAGEQLARLGARFAELGVDRTSVNVLSDLTYLCRLLLLLYRLRPNVIISYTAKPVIWGSIAARVFGVPRIIAMITGLGFAFTPDSRRGGVLPYVVEFLYRGALQGCHSVVFQNPDDRAEFVTRRFVRAEASFVVNGSGVNVRRFAPVSLPNDAVFLLIARLLEDKGIRQFCEAGRQLHTRFPRARFRIVGWFDSNPHAVSRETLAEWCGNGIIDYRGPVDDVRPEIAAARVYVLPSYYREGTPRTVLEAMAMGRPVITTDVPGCRETVRDGWNGYLVPPRDSGALAAAMERFIVSPELAASMGANSRALAEEKYDATRVARSVIEGAAL
jgi:glycosyltransferase involved in cell wall biosynthesis